MPREGYSSISVKDELHNKLVKIADQENTTIPKLLEKIMQETNRIPQVVTA